jgi:GAF domain-containing protein
MELAAGSPEGVGPLGAGVRETGIRSAVGTPMIVEGRLWGVMGAGSSLAQPLPADTEARLASFTELLAAAIANAESRAGLTRLAEQQAALRRVATLVGQGAAPEEVFAAVTEEVGRLLPVDHAGMGRYEPDGQITIVASWGTTADHFPVGSRWMLEGKDPGTIVFATGRSARVDSFADATGRLAVAVRETGVRSGVATPIMVEGRLWGMIGAGSTEEQPMPAASPPA